jgi:hypothetical protein
MGAIAMRTAEQAARDVLTAAQQPSPEAASTGAAPTVPALARLRAVWQESAPVRAEVKRVSREAVRALSGTQGHPDRLKMPRDRAYYLLAGGLGLTYFTTGFAKSLDVRGFRDVLDTYELYPSWALWPIAAGMTATELFLAYSFFTGRKLDPLGLAGSYIISGGGAIVLFTELIRGIDLPNCGCWGVFFANPLKWFTPWEDVAMVAMTIGVQRKLRGQWAARGEKALGAAAAAPASAAVAEHAANGTAGVRTPAAAPA